MIRPIHRLGGTIFAMVTLVALSPAQRPASENAGPELKIQSDIVVAQVSPTLYGLMKRILYVKVVNASSKPQSLEIELTGKDKPTGNAASTTLGGHSMEVTNSFAAPARIVPVQREIRDVSSDWRHTFPPYSIQVIDVTLH